LPSFLFFFPRTGFNIRQPYPFFSGEGRNAFFFFSPERGTKRPLFYRRSTPLLPPYHTSETSMPFLSFFFSGGGPHRPFLFFFGQRAVTESSPPSLSFARGWVLRPWPLFFFSRLSGVAAPADIPSFLPRGGTMTQRCPVPPFFFLLQSRWTHQT